MYSVSLSHGMFPIGNVYRLANRRPCRELYAYAMISRGWLPASVNTLLPVTEQGCTMMLPTAAQTEYDTSFTMQLCAVLSGFGVGAELLDSFEKGALPGAPHLPPCLVTDAGDYTLADWPKKRARYAPQPLAWIPAETHTA